MMDIFFITVFLLIASRCDEYEDCFDKSDEVGCEGIVLNNTIYEDDGDEDIFYEDDYSDYLDYSSNDTINDDV